MYSRRSLAISRASAGPSTAPLSASALDRVMACPLRFRPISTAMSFFGPAVPRCTPWTRPYSTWAKSSSPLTSLSRTPAHDASLETMMLTPCFLSRPSTEAMTTLAQSVSAMMPILISFFSGASEPCACTSARSAGLTPTAPTLAACSTGRRWRLVGIGGVIADPFFAGGVKNENACTHGPGTGEEGGGGGRVGGGGGGVGGGGGRFWPGGAAGGPGAGPGPPLGPCRPYA